jgi:hypothetical protein
MRQFLALCGNLARKKLNFEINKKNQEGIKIQAKALTSFLRSKVNCEKNTLYCSDIFSHLKPGKN